MGSIFEVATAPPSRPSVTPNKRPPPGPRDLPASPNVVLLVFDAMRRDVLGAYGGSALTPNLDAFAGESTVYPNCIAPSPWTIPSHVSLFSGKYPSEHGVHETREKKAVDLLGLPSGVKGEMLAETLRSKGYQTIGFPANPMLALRPGFDRGFDSFFSHRGYLAPPEDLALLRETFEKGKSKPSIVLDFLRRGEVGKLVRLLRVTRKIKKFRAESDYPRNKHGDLLVDAVRGAKLDPPFFLFANFMEMHDPYVDYELRASNRGPFPTVGTADLYGYKQIGEEDMGIIRRGYYSNATVLDRHFGALVSVLKEKGVYEDTIVVVTSDHGQALKERGYYGHGTFLHDEIARIPLLVKGAGGRKPKQAEGYQSLVGIPGFIRETVEGGDGGKALDCEVASAESFGVQQAPPGNLPPPLAEKVEGVMRKVDRPAKAAYMNGFRVLVDPSSWEVLEFSRGGREEPPAQHRGDVEAMVSELKRLEGSAPKLEAEGEVLSPEEERAVAERLRELGYL